MSGEVFTQLSQVSESSTLHKAYAWWTEVKAEARDKPLPGVPEPPKSLDVAARKHWREVTSQMNRAGLLTLLDADALMQYVSLWSRWLEAEEKVKAEGAVIVARNGYSQPNPWYTISVQCMKDMKSFMDMLGMSPKSRSKLTVVEPEVIDPKWKDFDK